MKRFLAITRIWILAVPFLLSLLGAGLNQLVLRANGNRFPVQFNDYKRAQYRLALEIQAQDKNFDKAITAELALVALKDQGFLDDTHIVMTPETHLNFLADWIDLHSAIYSPGDLLIESGDYLSDYAPLVWGAVLALALYKRED